MDVNIGKKKKSTEHKKEVYYRSTNKELQAIVVWAENDHNIPQDPKT